MLSLRWVAILRGLPRWPMRLQQPRLGLDLRRVSLADQGVRLALESGDMGQASPTRPAGPRQNMLIFNIIFVIEQLFIPHLTDFGNCGINPHGHPLHLQR